MGDGLLKVQRMGTSPFHSPKVLYQLKTESIHKIENHFKGTTVRINTFFEKTKIFDRKPQISKRDLSPNRIIKQGRNKRKNGTNLTMNAKKRMRSAY